MKSRSALSTIGFLLITAALGVGNIVRPTNATVSELENRELRKRPLFSSAALLQGIYFRDYEDFYSDTFICRDWFVKTARDLREHLRLFASDVSLIVRTESIPITKELSNEEGTHDVNVATVAPEKLSYWLIVDGRAVELFKYNRKRIEAYAEKLNRMHQLLGKEVKLYTLTAPAASEFARLRHYKKISDSQNEAISYLSTKLKKEIKNVNIYEVLNAHRDEAIYFRTDHHWTGLGAYYAYSEFIKLHGDKPRSLDDFKKHTVAGFLGSSYTKTLSKVLEKNPDSITYYTPPTKYTYQMVDGTEARNAPLINTTFAERKDKYTAFLNGGGATWSVISTDVKNGKSILILKDSFANAFVPFLLPHFEKIFVIDTRFYRAKFTGMNIIDFVHSNGIQSVAFVDYMENINSAAFLSEIDSLMAPSPTKP